MKNLIDLIGDKGREVLRETFKHIEEKGDHQPISKCENEYELGPAVQTVTYSGGIGYWQIG